MNQIIENTLLMSLFILGISTVTSIAAITAEVPAGTEIPQSQNREFQPSNLQVVASVTTSEAPIINVSTSSNTNLTTQQTSATYLTENSRHDDEDATSRNVPVQQDATPVNQDSTQRLAQVTSVSQLSDVQPTDWAFQALQSLVERYGCIAGYPDVTYRGNRALTRYEFAAGLNACLDRVNELIAAATTDLIRREDLATLQRLQEEFRAELATLQGRVDSLEAATAELEANQFSTTTKLNSEVVIALTDTFGNGLNRSGNTTGQELNDNTVLQGRARINFDTSFTGQDQLRVRLQAANFTPLNYLGDITNEGQLSYAVGGDLDNQFVLYDMFYQFPIGDRIVAHLLVVGGEFDDYLNVVDPLLSASGTGAVGNFSYNPIYNVGGNVGNLSSAGLGLDFKLTDKLAVNLGYLGGEGNNPNIGSGLFNGDNSFLARAEYVDKSFQIAAETPDSVTEGSQYLLALRQ